MTHHWLEVTTPLAGRVVDIDYRRPDWSRRAGGWRVAVATAVPSDEGLRLIWTSVLELAVGIGAELRPGDVVGWIPAPDNRTDRRT